MDPRNDVDASPWGQAPNAANGGTDLRTVVQRIVGSDVEMQRRLIEADRNMIVGLNVLRVRRARKIGQDVLAKRMGVQQSAISRYESGAGRSYSLEQILRLAGALGVEPFMLLEGALAVPEIYKRVPEDSQEVVPAAKR